MEKANVVIAIPSVDGYVHGRTIQALIPQMNGRVFAIQMGETPAAKARNSIVKNFLENKEATHLFMVDADTIPPSTVIETLLALDVPIASGITPTIQDGDMIYNIYRELEGKLAPYPKDYPIPQDDRMIVKAVGASCILVRREVFEKMGESPWFFDTWTQADQFISEDIMFCNTARSLGYDIVVSPKVMCRHERSIVI